MRYHVKNEDGQELVVPTLADLHALYTQGFLSDDDLVRSESTERWVRAGILPALHGVRLQRADPRKMGALLAGAIAVATGIALLLAR